MGKKRTNNYLSESDEDDGENKTRKLQGEPESRSQEPSLLRMATDTEEQEQEGEEGSDAEHYRVLVQQWAAHQEDGEPEILLSGKEQDVLEFLMDKDKKFSLHCPARNKSKVLN